MKEALFQCCCCVGESIEWLKVTRDSSFREKDIIGKKDIIGEKGLQSTSLFSSRDI